MQLLFFFIGARRNMLALSLVGLALVIGGTGAADTAGFGNHPFTRNSDQVELKHGWKAASSNREAQDKYGDCGKDISIDGGKVTIHYKKGSQAAKTGCTFDLISTNKPYAEFTVRIKNLQECAVSNKDPGKASVENALPFAINMRNPRANGLCFERYKCQETDTRRSPPCGKPERVGGSLCKAGCLEKPLYEVSWTRQDFHMSMVGDPQFCQKEKGNHGEIYVKFSEVEGEVTYTFGSTKSKTTNKYAGNNRAFCLFQTKLPTETKNLPIKGKPDTYLTTIHLLPQSVLYRRKFPNGEKDYRGYDIEGAALNSDNYPRCDIEIEFQLPFMLLVGPPDDKSPPACIKDDSIFSKWWFYAVVIAGSLLLVEIIAFVLWLFLVRWRKPKPGEKHGRTGMTTRGRSRMTTRGGSRMSRVKKLTGWTRLTSRLGRTKKGGRKTKGGSKMKTAAGGTKKGGMTTKGGSKMKTTAGGTTKGGSTMKKSAGGVKDVTYEKLEGLKPKGQKKKK